MSIQDDEVTKALLSEYSATAENLLKGVNVTQETMNRYHGMTGKLLVGVTGNLWSQQELDDQIDRRHTELCKNCESKKSGVIVYLKAFSPFKWPLAIMCFSPFAGDIVARVIAAFSK